MQLEKFFSMKQIIFSILAISLLTTIGCKDDATIITMTTIKGEVAISVAGSILGTFFIDWGDDSPIEKHKIRSSNYWAWSEEYKYTHSYNNASSHTIKIIGSEVTHLACEINQIIDLDVSKNTRLRELRCDINQLTNLDVSRNIALETLTCHNNQLTSLDVSKNTALKRLDCPRNQLTDLDMSKNVSLTDLSCWNNQLTSLSVNSIAPLTWLDCNNNQLTRSALNALFEMLPDNIKKKFIYIDDNPGTESCDQSIVTKKGWIFTNE